MVRRFQLTYSAIYAPKQIFKLWTFGHIARVLVAVWHAIAPQPVAAWPRAPIKVHYALVLKVIFPLPPVADAVAVNETALLVLGASVVVDGGVCAVMT